MTAAKKTAKKAVNANDEFEVTPVHFVIEVTLEQDDDAPKPYPVPRNIPQEMHRGDTVSYESPDGEVTVNFDEPDKSVHRLKQYHSPFVDAHGDEIRTVTSKDDPVQVGNRGKYFGKCSITVTKMTSRSRSQRMANTTGMPRKPLKPGRYIWSIKTPEAGGNHIVKP